jgi:hypothetical protein
MGIRTRRPSPAAACCALALLALLLLNGCVTSMPSQDVPARPFKMRDLAKSDVDLVAEIHLRETMSHLQKLMVKLYKRNPGEWKKGASPSGESVARRVFDGRWNWDFPELQGKRGTACIHLAFDERYRGDRVLAFVVGIASMILTAHNGKAEFFLIDDLDPQKLYNSARNVEIANWKLGNDRTANGELYLLSNSMVAEDRNLSFERLFGKIIAHQDTLAIIMAEKTNRTIKHVIQRVAGVLFLPI